MYTMVLMMAMSGSGDVASWHHKDKGAGCNGAVVVNGCSGYACTGCSGAVAYTSCNGSTSCDGGSKKSFLGLRDGGFLGLRDKKKGSTSCTGCTGYTSCTGVPNCCPLPTSCTGCTGVKVGCTGYVTGCTGYSTGCTGYTTGCTGGVIVGYPAVTTAPVTMPAAGTTGEKPAEKKPADAKKTDDK